MNRITLIIRQKIFGIIFIIIAIIGGIFIFLYISNLKARVSEDMEYRQIFVASDDIGQGEEITEESIKMQRISGNMFSEKFVIDKDKVLGKKVIEDIMEGEIITVDKLEVTEYDNGSNYGFSSYIPDQLRAVSIPVNFYGDKSLIRTGDKVDIISTYYEPESGVIYSNTVLSEKEVVLIKSGLNESYSGEEYESGSILTGSFFDNSSAYPDYTNLIILTFYLDVSETENVFLALERGLLNLSICPGGSNRSSIDKVYSNQ